jgi:hypothetical protein
MPRPKNQNTVTAAKSGRTSHRCRPCSNPQQHHHDDDDDDDHDDDENGDAAAPAHDEAACDAHASSSTLIQELFITCYEDVQKLEQSIARLLRCEDRLLPAFMASAAYTEFRFKLLRMITARAEQESPSAASSSSSISSSSSSSSSSIRSSMRSSSSGGSISSPLVLHLPQDLAIRCRMKNMMTPDGSSQSRDRACVVELHWRNGACYDDNRARCRLK